MTTYAESGCPFTGMGKDCPDPDHRHPEPPTTPTQGEQSGQGDDWLRELARKHAHYEHSGLTGETCTAFDEQELHMFFRQAKAAIQAQLDAAYQRGRIDESKTAPEEAVSLSHRSSSKDLTADSIADEVDAVLLKLRGAKYLNAEIIQARQLIVAFTQSQVDEAAYSGMLWGRWQELAYWTGNGTIRAFNSESRQKQLKNMTYPGSTELIRSVANGHEYFYLTGKLLPSKSTQSKAKETDSE